MFDFVEAELDISGNDHLPRITPLRYGAGISLEHGVFNASVDYMYVDEQDDVADFELPTDSYNDLRVYLGADIPVGSTTMVVFVHGKNLTDDEQRYHASFIKDFAPAPGRTYEVGLRIQF
jgi:iron complex outermembrane receptor protein